MFKDIFFIYKAAQIFLAQQVPCRISNYKVDLTPVFQNVLVFDLDFDLLFLNEA